MLLLVLNVAARCLVILDCLLIIGQVNAAELAPFFATHLQQILNDYWRFSYNNLLAIIINFDALPVANYQYLILFAFKMRSLFVDDIPGAKPKRHYFDKAIYRERHEEEIVRHSKKNPQQKRVIQWYRPMKKTTEPLDRQDDDQFRTKKTLKKSYEIESQDLAKSMPMSQIRSKSTMFSNDKMSKSSVLSGTGRNLLMNPGAQDPYFPHRYVDKVVGERNKWSGSRAWQDQATQVINLPATKDSYFKQW